MESIIQSERKCLFCERTEALHKHHIYYGRGLREISERYGCVCWLCADHHTGPAGVHHDKALDNNLKVFTQRRFEERYPDISFREVFGRSYL